jgi:L-iditol 2-dehydrogenase
MKQAVLKAPGNIEIVEIEEPAPHPGEVLVKVERIGICGSDIHVYHGVHPFTSFPVVQGHEYSGTVVAIGEGVAGLHPGMKVTSLPQIVCGQCAPCRRGDYHICDHLKVKGFQAPGFAQELSTVPYQQIAVLPDDLSYEEGALVEPVAVAVHAIRKVLVIKGVNVAVLGGGPIGNLVAQIAQSEGGNVLLTDISEHRLSIARQCGIRRTLNPGKDDFAAGIQSIFGPEKYAVAFECVGVEETIRDAIENIAKGGTIVVVGVYGNQTRLNLSLVQDRELQIMGSLMYQREDYIRAVEYIHKGMVKTGPLISKHFPLNEYLKAYQFIEEQGNRVMKVFIEVAEKL